MNQRLIAEIGRTQRLQVINSLKRTRGLSVNELVEKMGMSYMGIKQHCLTLQRDGYLDTWRRPQRMGRPEMVYRLTRRSHDLFQADSHQFTLDLLKSIQEIYGPNAPEKLLYNIFEKKTAALKAKAKGRDSGGTCQMARPCPGWGGLHGSVYQRSRRRTPDCRVSLANHEFNRSLPDHWAPRAGHVRSRPRDSCAPANDSQLGALRVRVLFRGVILLATFSGLPRFLLSQAANLG